MHFPKMYKCQAEELERGLAKFHCLLVQNREEISQASKTNDELHEVAEKLREQLQDFRCACPLPQVTSDI